MLTLLLHWMLHILHSMKILILDNFSHLLILISLLFVFNLLLSFWKFKIWRWRNKWRTSYPKWTSRNTTANSTHWHGHLLLHHCHMWRKHVGFIGHWRVHWIHFLIKWHWHILHREHRLFLSLT